MTDIVAREQIAEQARAAAEEHVRTGAMPPNPYQPNTPAAIEFDVALSRYMAGENEDVDGGAK